MNGDALRLAAAGLAATAVCLFAFAHSISAAVALASLPLLWLAFLALSRAIVTRPTRMAEMSWLALLAAAPPWQASAVTAAGAVSVEAGSDPAKLVVTGIAFGVLFFCRPVGSKYAWPVKALLAYGVISFIGAGLGTDATSSVLRSVRWVAVVLAVTWASQQLSRRRLALLTVLLAAVVSVAALFGAAAGLTVSEGGRLGGYLPPLQPNDLGVISATGALCAIVLLLRGEIPRLFFGVSAPLLVATLALTESRASMAGLLIALFVLAFPRLQRHGPTLMCVMIVAFLGLLILQENTSVQPLSAALTHNGTTSTTSTLGSRTSEWKSVAELNVTYVEKLFGQGLADKTVPVVLPYTAYATLDGTWPSAYLSVGAVGVLVLAGGVLAAIRMAWSRRDGFALALIALLVSNSLVEDTFNDVSTSVVLFLSIGVVGLAAAEPAVVPDSDQRWASTMRSAEYV